MAKQGEPTRVLCLHGKGVDGVVFASQTRALRTALGPHYELIYVDAPHRCGRYPGIERFFPNSPGLSWYDETGESKQAAIERIKSLVQEHRASAVLGFSQGAAIAAACNATTHIFDWAVYIGGGWPMGDWQVNAPGSTRQLSVPGVHVIGTLDVGYSRGMELYKAQHDGHLLEWRGHHEVPKDHETVQALVRLINLASREKRVGVAD